MRGQRTWEIGRARLRRFAVQKVVGSSPIIRLFFSFVFFVAAQRASDVAVGSG
jgi:hypothetical protein